MWSVHNVDLIHHTQTSNVTAVLQWLECDVLLMRCFEANDGFRPSLDLNQQVEVRWRAGGPDEWAVLHEATHLRIVQRCNTRPVQEMTDAPNAAQLPCSGPRYLLDVACVCEATVILHSKDLNGVL